MDVTEDVAAPELAAPGDEGGKTGKSYGREIWLLLAVAVALALIMKTFLIQAFFIPSGSMEKTLHGCEDCRGDRVLVNKVVYKFRDIHRGEIVVFNGEGTAFTAETTVQPPRNIVQKVLRTGQAWLGFGAPGEEDFIKRVIGVPGDIVACCTNGNVTVNGAELHEPYVYLNISKTQMPFDPVKVPAGELYLMGDHRDGSQDSRFNGPVPASKVVGRAFAVFFPPGRAKSLRVPKVFDPDRTDAASLPYSPAAPPVLALALAVPVRLLGKRVRKGFRRGVRL